jgi:hypothetical protein
MRSSFETHLFHKLPYHPLTVLPVVPPYVSCILSPIVMYCSKRQQFAMLLSLASLGSLVLAKDTYLYQESYGISVPADADDYTQSLVKTAIEHPNATRSINFRPFGSATQQENLRGLKDIEWTWRKYTNSISPSLYNKTTQY